MGYHGIGKQTSFENYLIIIAYHWGFLHGELEINIQ